MDTAGTLTSRPQAAPTPALPPALPRWVPARTRVLNHLLGPAARSTLAQGGHTWCWQWQTPTSEAPCSWVITLVADGVHAWLALPDAHSAVLDAGIDMAAFDGMAQGLAAALRYSALLDHLAQLSGRHWDCVAVHGHSGQGMGDALDQHAASTTGLRVGLRVTPAGDQPGIDEITIDQGGAFTGVLHLPDEHLLSWRHATGEPAPAQLAWRRLRTRLALSLALTLALPRARLADLCVGAALLLGTTDSNGVAATLSAGDAGLLLHGQLRGRSFVSTGSVSHAQALFEHSFGDTPMPPPDDVADGSTPSLQEAQAATQLPATVANLPVQLQFHLGELLIPFDELAAVLATGRVLELDRPLNERAVSVRAGGREVARGELLQVADQLAVRISQLVPAHGPV
jgi:flagellar motor switch/type III secretory pathway protein FliN